MTLFSLFLALTSFSLSLSFHTVDSFSLHRTRTVSVSPLISKSRTALFFSPDDHQSNAPPVQPRRSIVAGNWKLNPATLTEATTLLRLLKANFENHRDASSATEVVVFPPFPFLGVAVQELQGTGIQVGCQTIGTHEQGAFTGEVAPSMIQSMGVTYVMLGHSERRTLFGESDTAVNNKLQLCLAQRGLQVILCVGETLQEYETNLLASVVDVQLKKALVGVSSQDVLERIVVAYEPVWAIGTGKTATPSQAQAAHEAVRATLTALYGSHVAQGVRIQYGGSVTPDNIDALMAQPDVDGALVGGASLTADSFTRIVDGGIRAASATSSAYAPPPVELTATEVVPCANVLGESPVWSVRDQALYWISAPEGELWTWKYHGDNNQHNRNEPPYRRLIGTTLGCTALLEGEPHAVLLAGESAFMKMTMKADSGDFASSSSCTATNFLCERPEQDQATRPNDGRVDRQQRMVFGMYNNYHREGSSAGENNCGLYRLDANLQLESLLDYKYRVSNCICFPASGDTIFFCDTPTRKVYAFDYPVLTNRREIWTMPSEWPGGPDGAQVDADGCIWMALSGAHRVVRVNPDTGHMDFVVHLPVSSPTSCTFGGPNLDELFITTRKPDGGGLFRVKMPFGIRGLPEPEFRVNNNNNNNLVGQEQTTTQPTAAAVAVSSDNVMQEEGNANVQPAAGNTAATYASMAAAYKQMTNNGQ
ncbi:Triosephosphate isomerase [Seminavis robusta]|uniref:triose-phosphate isomerase n=1 Tax=Seminavis robusta TaxID=568900 RepID=A0A9N8DNI0_9STRA|nr:Triosephosphate isomerase [Seminavis robusta]|eukprot:Sro260_g101520.1 Triosephosphate isomerase (707) ;mRNA; r:22476-24596